MACPFERSAREHLRGDIDHVERERFEAHLPGCPNCARVVGSGIRSTPEPARVSVAEDQACAPGTFARGTAVGRYIILSLLGRGGMGDVYSAYDPRLDRKVALKLLRETATGTPIARAANQERLLREAQSTARLSHRNVVTVYDAGTIEGQAGHARVFVAMELVDGQTLSAWLAEKRRSWREIRDLFVAAGEGLLAAHEAALVHRDFKPQNVMVGRDGTVRVMDFGLAGDGLDSVGGDEPLLDLSSSMPPTTQTIALTHTGVLLGTPLYMAPEQFLGRKTEARTDQFAFCVALYEALYGERPFPANTFAELVAAVSAGRVREVPARASVPAFLQRMLRKGLSPDPDSRFASMRDVLAALVADPLRHRRSVAVVLALTVVLLTTIAGAQRIASQGQRMCRGAADKLRGIWELDEWGPRRSAVRKAFQASGSALADDTWTRVAGLLDDYSRRWSAAYTDTCEATHVRGDQSTEVLDLRMTCLDGERGALRALIDVFSHADPQAVAGGVSAAYALPAIEMCADVVALRAVVPPPTDPGIRARVTALERRVAEVKALIDTGQWVEAQTRIGYLTDAASTIGYQPLLAEALDQRAWLEDQLDGPFAAARTAEQAVRVALATRQDDVAAEMSEELFDIYGRYGPVEESDYWTRLAESLLQRLGPGHERLAAWFHENRGIVLHSKGDLVTALRELQAGLSLKEAVLPAGHPDIAISLESIAKIHTELGDADIALGYAQRALAIERASYGSRSAITASGLEARGEVLALLHRYDEAERDLRVALGMASGVLGQDHPYLAEYLTALGKTLMAIGKYGEAEPLLEHARKIRERSEPNAALVAQTRFALAMARWTLDHDRPGALKLAVTARDSYRNLSGQQAHADEIDTWLAHKSTTERGLAGD